jgi:hypothetical protein
VTAIRENDPGTGPTGLGSGNPYLVGQGDPNWQPLGAPADNHNGTNFTPPFPSYTSGHAGFGGALFETMKDYFGTDNIHFTIVSDEFNTITIDQNGNPRPLIPRSFDSFSQAADENGQSRIYLGIHWKFDKVQGIKLGGEVADYVFSHFMATRPNHSALGSNGGTGAGAAPTAASDSANQTSAAAFLGASLVSALAPMQQTILPVSNQLPQASAAIGVVTALSWSAPVNGLAESKESLTTGHPSQLSTGAVRPANLINDQLAVLQDFATWDGQSR